MGKHNNRPAMVTPANTIQRAELGAMFDPVKRNMPVCNFTTMNRYHYIMPLTVGSAWSFGWAFLRCAVACWWYNLRGRSIQQEGT